MNNFEHLSDELLEKAASMSYTCTVCNGRGFLPQGTCNCCAAGAWARRLMRKDNEIQEESETKREQKSS